MANGSDPHLYSPPHVALDSSSCEFAFTKVKSEPESFVDPELWTLRELYLSKTVLGLLAKQVGFCELARRQ